jgi:spore coat polysaccharide biosynthesis predicted glycosyltransferase SpsG
LKKIKRKVVIRADGNPLIGMGHFTRTLALAEILKDDFDCIFVTINPTKYQESEVLKHCKSLITLQDEAAHIDDFLEHLKGDEIVLLDNYNYTAEFQLQIKSKGCKVVYIDDFNDKHYVCDALINNIPGFEPESFKREEYTKLYLGIDYALLRKDFLKKEWRAFEKKENTIFLSFGGSDLNNLTIKFIEYLKTIDSHLEVNVLI